MPVTLNTRAYLGLGAPRVLFPELLELQLLK